MGLTLKDFDAALGTVPSGGNGQPAPPIGESIPDGARNVTLTSRAGSMRRRGFSEAAILAALREENAKCVPARLPDRELAAIARSVGRYTPASTSAAMLTEHHTDLGNARRLVAGYGDRFRWCELWNTFLVYDDTRWVRDDRGQLMRWAKETVVRMYSEGADVADESQRKAFVAHALRSESESRLRAMVNLARSEDGIPIAPDALDLDPWLLNCRNGTLDLRTGTLREHRPDDFITKLAPVEYDPGAIAPTFDAFLRRIFADDPTMAQYVQQATGYSLTGQTSEQCWFLNYGIGANGKSTILNVLTDLLGDYATWTPTQTLLAKRGEGIDNDLARLRGARFVAAVETDGGRRLAEALVKQMTGGDRMAARFLYGEFFEFTPQFKLWLATNHKPEIRGTDHATWRRVRLIPFTVTIPDAEQDRSLPEKLRLELPGILRWAVEGCLAWQRNGLGLPDAVREATTEYRASMDLIGTFLAECCETTANVATRASRLYSAYVAWTEEGREQPESQRRFGEALAERRYTRGRDVSGHVVWRGIRLRSEPSEGSEPIFRKL